MRKTNGGGEDHSGKRSSVEHAKGSGGDGVWNETMRVAKANEV